MNKAISYTRFSTPEQAKGDSYRRQYEACSRYCKENSLDLIDEFEDAGISAFKGKNRDEGALKRILDKIQNGEYPKGTVLIVESLDRLSRDTINKQLSLFLEIVNNGVDVVTLSDGERRYSGDNLDLIGLIISLTVMSRAHEESAIKSMRLSAAWKNKKEKARNGQILTKAIPAWLEVKNDQFVVNSKRERIIQSIFELSINENLGSHAIASELNSRGIKPFGTSRKNTIGKWGKTYITKLLSDKRLLGVLQPMKKTSDGIKVKDGEPILEYFPAIISEDVFYESASKRSQRLTTNNGRKSNTLANNLFKGLCKCSECEANVHYVSKNKEKNWIYMTCSKKCSNSRSMHYDVLENLILAMVPTLDTSDVESQNRDIQSRNDVRHGKMLELESELVTLSKKWKASKSPTILEMIEENEADIITLKSEMESLIEITGEWWEYLVKKDFLDEKWRIQTQSQLANIIESIHAVSLLDGVSVKLDLIGGKTVYGWLKRDTIGVIDSSGSVGCWTDLATEFAKSEHKVFSKIGTKRFNPW